MNTIYVISLILLASSLFMLLYTWVLNHKATHKIRHFLTNKNLSYSAHGLKTFNF